MTRAKANALIGQSGGPTCVINQSLVGLVEACAQSDAVGAVYGALHGTRGILDEQLVDLGRERPEDLEAVARTPCAALRSVRMKPTLEDCQRIVDVFRAHDVRYFFYIGGNDSSEAAQVLERVAQDVGYELTVIHVPKTIDNDLLVTDHCPGFGSAARFVAQALMGDNEDNRSLPGVKIDVVMGRHAGWLTAATRLARHTEDDGPHLVYVPERVFELDSFLGDVEDVHARLGRCVVAVSEGIHQADGTLIGKSKEVDSFGNVQLSGSGALGDLLATHVRTLGSKLRVRADTFGYLQRSYFGVASETDSREAREVGREAVRVATRSGRSSGSMVILREDGGEYAVRYDVTDLERVAGKTKTLPDEFIEGSSGISERFLAYVRPLAGPLPRPGRLAEHRVPPRLA